MKARGVNLSAIEVVPIADENFSTVLYPHEQAEMTLISAGFSIAIKFRKLFLGQDYW